ncbi:Ctr copper transporter, partial [Leucosporidium creatinivorum]
QDMGTTNSTTSTMMMTSFTTALGASNLWFTSWTPTSAGATAGASIGLFFLAIFSRLLSAVRSSAEQSWAETLALRRQAIRLDLIEDKSFAKASSSSSSTTANDRSPSVAAKLKQAPPFLWSIDAPRAALFGVQAFVGYLLMLAVMSYSAWFYIAIIVGMMTGELLFGRWSTHAGAGDGLHH